MTGDFEALIDPEDREYVSTVADRGQRDIIAASLMRYRSPERLTTHDPVPAVTLRRVDSAELVELGDLLGERPVVLVFGSYT